MQQNPDQFAAIMWDGSRCECSGVDIVCIENDFSFSDACSVF